MAKILFKDSWFEEVLPGGGYESPYEAVLIAQAPMLWPDYIAVRFKATVYSEDSAAKADFALVERNYREWWVGEVELAHHSLDAHVLPQVRTLSQAAYGLAEAAKLADENTSLDILRVRDMLKGRQPRVLVVVNTPRPEWVRALLRYDACLGIFEVFRSGMNEYVFRVNGEHPVGRSEIVTHCRFDPNLPRWMVVDAPGGLGGAPNCPIKILYRDKVTDWVRVESADTVWIRSPGPNALDPKFSYQILRQPDGTLVFKPVPKERR